MAMHLPHPSDCNKFFKCQNGTGKEESCPKRLELVYVKYWLFCIAIFFLLLFAAIEFACKADLHFDAAINTCNWPNQANCENQIIRENTTPFSTSTTTRRRTSIGGPVMRTSTTKPRRTSSGGPVRRTSTTTEKPRRQTITQKPRRRTSTMKPTFEDILGRQPFSTKRPSNRGRPPTFTENPPKM